MRITVSGECVARLATSHALMLFLVCGSFKPCVDMPRPSCTETGPQKRIITPSLNTAHQKVTGKSHVASQKKVCNFPHWKHGYLIKIKSCSSQPKLPQIDTTDTRMLVRYTTSDWPVTDDLGRQAKEFPPTASHYRPCRPARSHSTSSGWRQPCQTASPKCPKYIDKHSDISAHSLSISESACGARI